MGVKERLSHYFVTYKQLFLLVLDNIRNVFSSQLESVSLFTRSEERPCRERV